MTQCLRKADPQSFCHVAEVGDKCAVKLAVEGEHWKCDAVYYDQGGALMLDRLTLPETHAISIILEDHDTVKDLFDRFEKAESAAEKEKIIELALTELKIHAVIEEEVFYPTVRKHVGKDIMNEADEEHHVARVLIAELDATGRGNDHRDAKFMVLSESVRHHIKEEEKEMLPKAKEIDIDFEALGQQMLDRKEELKEDGIPSDAEHAMMRKAHGRAHTPAAAARGRKSGAKNGRARTAH
jgi:hemerythrin superfamily protein